MMNERATRSSQFTGRQWTWAFAVALLLLTWGLRLCCLKTVPPGWRDDALINTHALSGELLEGRFPLYFTGASGHEPLYHYLHAGVHAMLGFNVLSGQLMSVACGTLSVALAYTLTRRLFGRSTAALASLALAMSFWSLMYSRIALRHISLPPIALAAFAVLWRSLDRQRRNPRNRQSASLAHRDSALLGLLLGAGLYTYPAARLLPVLLLLFFAYLALTHRALFSSRWRALLVALGIMAVLAMPLGVAIARGSSEAGAQGIGADARLAELAVPLRELRAGNPRPLLENIVRTLGMFHATGDPEWLYNIPDRPVFNLLGGALLWAGVGLCLLRWRRPRYFFLLLWLGSGLLPAFVSTPAASLSHTILAQPVAYILPTLTLSQAIRWLRAPATEPAGARRSLVILPLSLIVLFLATNAIRDLRDYFRTWPQEDMVRLLYRADCREAAQHLDAHPDIVDVAISSALLGPWDRLALEVDIQRKDVAVRLFNPERALLWVAGEDPATVLLTSWPHPAPPVDGFLEAGRDPPAAISTYLRLHTLPAFPDLQRDPSGMAPDPGLPACFSNGLELVGATWIDEGSPASGREAVLLAAWRVAAPLDLPPTPIVANPPPPGVYSGPRLAVFAHLLGPDRVPLANDDGLWVDPLTLQTGDRFVQAHRFALPPGAPAGPYIPELGLYDPLTGERWAVLNTEGEPVADRVLLAPAGPSAPP